jgi:hypothetical protein
MFVRTATVEAARMLTSSGHRDGAEAFVFG